MSKDNYLNKLEKAILKKDEKAKDIIKNQGDIFQAMDFQHTFLTYKY